MSMPSYANAPFHMPRGTPGNQHGKKWTDEQDDALQRHIASYGTFDEIAVFLNKEFGTSYSRCAVSGRMMRLGLKSLNAAHVRVGLPQAPRNKPKPREKIERPPKPPRPSADVIQFRCEQIVPLHIAFNDLETDHCRWMYGNPDKGTYCGHKKMENARLWFCFDHFQLATGNGTTSERRAMEGVR